MLFINNVKYAKIALLCFWEKRGESSLILEGNSPESLWKHSSEAWCVV